MRALVIGYGSIGARHARLLEERGASVACVTANEACPFPRFRDVAASVRGHVPELIIVANATGRHITTLNDIAATRFNGRILVEKPLGGGVSKIPERLSRSIHVGFNLRFHPIVSHLRSALAGHKLITCNFYAGMYLPDWRPKMDYRKSYSARRAEGGGVLQDLTHELDLALWLCGPWLRVAALGGKFSELEIDSDDVFSLLIETERCPVVGIHLNYLDRMSRRTVVVNAEGMTAAADLVAGRLAVGSSIQEINVERDDTYRAQLAAALGDNRSALCTLSEAAAVDSLVAMAEEAAVTGTWIVA